MAILMHVIRRSVNAIQRRIMCRYDYVIDAQMKPHLTAKIVVHRNR